MEVQLNQVFEFDLMSVYEYGVETFGLAAADLYRERVMHLIRGLNEFYLMYPECRYLATKNQIYRNIILDSYIIVYRISPQRIEVLRMLSSYKAISKIKAVRKIKM